MRPHFIQLREAENGEWYWVQVGGNGEVVSTSETYSRKGDAEESANTEAERLGGVEVGEQTPGGDES